MVLALVGEGHAVAGAEGRRHRPGRRPASLADAARVPVDALILDLATGPGLGPAVLRHRLVRPQTQPL